MILFFIGDASLKDIKDCCELPDGSPSGVYMIYPGNSSGFQVFCDMTAEDGAWTVSNILLALFVFHNY